MAGDVNIKMGVSGVAQFKQSISQAKQNLKTLDAQLKLTETQYKATGDAETYMQQKTEQLKSKLEEQKAIAASAEKALKDMTDRGVDKGSKAFQDMIRTLSQAKTDLLETQMKMDGIGDAGDDAANGVAEMNAQLKRVGDGVSFQNVSQGLGKITTGLQTAAKKAMNLGRKIADAMLEAGSYADDLKTRASVYGLSTDELQRMDKTANLIDTSVESILNAQKKLKKGIGSKDKGVMGAYAELLGEGYDPTKQGWEQAFWDAGKAIMRFTDEEEKEVYAQKLFGRSWNELIPLFEAGREEYEKTNASWKVLSEEQLNSLGKIDDEYQTLKANFEQLKLSMLSEFAEPFAELMKQANEKLNELSEWLESDEGKKAIADFSKAITDAFNWLWEHGEDVKNALIAIAGGFAALKIGNIATDVWRAVDGMKNLLGLQGKSKTGSGDTPTVAPTSTGSSLGNAVTVAATKAGSMVANGLLKSGMILPVVGDRLLNETSAGRAVRDGGDILEGAKQDWVDFESGVKKNLETFAEDWENNGIVQFFGDMAEAWKQNGQNTADYWSGIHQQQVKASNWILGDDATAEEAMAFVKSMEKMNQTAEELSGKTTEQTQSNSEMTQAAQGLTGLPAQIVNAIQSLMGTIGITIDGSVLMGYVNNQQATQIGP